MTASVVFDSTTFVNDTIREVLKTLGIAFALVVLVVFLFMGNLRATIIPAVAVPVSLIGTFAVLLAIGYSANTVSLLAMVLAIGIVVDDAIVVVENVERVMEEEPELSPGRGDEEGDGPDHRPDHRHHLGAAVGVRADRVHPGPFRPAVPPVRGHHRLAMVISAINALTLSPALCAVFLRHRGQARGVMALVLRGIDCARDGYAAIVRRLVRVAVVVAWRWSRCCGFGVFGWRNHADELPARRGSGRVHHFDATARRRIGGAHARGGARGRTAAAIDAASGARLLDLGLFVARRRRRSNAAFIVAKLKPFADGQGAADFRAGADRPDVRQRCADPRRHRPPVQPAADRRPVDQRRLRVPARERCEGQRPGEVAGVMRA